MQIPVFVFYRYGYFYPLDHLDTVVRNSSYVGSGEMAAKTIEGQGITIPYDTFRSTVDAGGDRYVVEFTVTESLSGGNAVHSVEIVKAPETQLRALYDQYMRAGAGNQSVETGGAKGYNGNGGARYSDGSSIEGARQEAGAEEYGELGKRIVDNWNGTDTERDLTTNGNQNESGEARTFRNTSRAEKIKLLDDYIKNSGIENLPRSSEKILKIAYDDLELAKNVVEATKEVIPGKTLLELVDIFKLPNNPAASSLSTYQTRIWYK